MKTKLHLGLLVILLAFLGTYLEQVTVPNQQIVIEFSAQTVTEKETENAIDAIQDKLQSIGVTQIQIGHNKAGQLRITYHSDVDVIQIQTVLLNTDNFKIANKDSPKRSSNVPENKSLINYELNISEIKSNSNINWSFEGIQVTEVNQKTDFSNPLKVNNSGTQLNAKQSEGSFKIAVLVNQTTAILIDHLSYKIPEVRAGPTV